MPPELTTQEQFAAFADEVARELGTHCRTAPEPEYTHMLSRVIIDGEGRALSLRQHDSDEPARLKVYAALPDDTQVAMPRIGVTAISARHIAGRSPGVSTRCMPRPPSAPPSSPPAQRPRPATAAL
ncbi:hypothetical protein [Streptomyces sp. NPDC005548]|uniref:hypothetical protein n=1 Tax=Streptomyces sp. NPDC005548 TaxID=3364724 RepID=UPI0036CD48E1